VWNPTHRKVRDGWAHPAKSKSNNNRRFLRQTQDRLFDYGGDSAAFAQDDNFMVAAELWDTSARR
jgi:hypothetical protein